MNAIGTFIAYLLLVVPVNKNGDNLYDLANRGNLVQEFFFNLQVIDRGDFRCNLNYDKHFWRDLYNYSCIAYDYRHVPRIEEARRFLTGHRQAEQACDLNDRYQRLLRGQIKLFPRNEELKLALKETEALHAVWDCVETATNPNNYHTSRRNALATLQTLLGDDYWLGRLPPPVPYWRFHQAN